MTVTLDAGAGDAPVGKSRVGRVRGMAGRLLGGIALFCAVFFGVQTIKTMHDDASPLPDDVARQGRCALWFIGSSSINKWATLGQDMAPWIAHNRGIGGASVDYLIHRFANEKRQTPPEAIVFYGGENDIFKGATAAASIARLQEFLALKTLEYGALPVFVISLKPSPTRWNNLPEQNAFNRAARAIAAQRADVTFINIVPLMLVNGRPGPFYQDDGVHLTEVGYARWAGAVQQALHRTLPRQVVENCAR